MAFHAGRDEVIALAGSELVNAFRRVILDPVRGLVMLMSPSSGHETTSSDLDRFVSSVASLKGIKVEQLRATRWRRENDPKNTGNEADCSFYFGQKAIDYVRAYSISEADADSYSFRVPPDLVVEVGPLPMNRRRNISATGTRERSSSGKLNIHRRAQRRIITATFLDLQAQPGPLEVDTSLNLPGLTPAHVIRFIQLRSGKSLDYLEVYEAVRGLLARDALEIREEAEEYELAG